MSEPPRITSIEPRKPRGLRVLVHLDRGEPFEILLETLERSRLGVGDELPPNRRHHLLDVDADLRVREAALNLLSYRARTRTELARRLRQKGFRPARIEPCLDRLQEKGFIDDEAVAAAFVRDRLRHRPRGRARLVSELRAKGIPAESASRSIERVFEDEGIDDVRLARSVAEAWVRRQGQAVLAALAAGDRTKEQDAARRRLHGYLARRGFAGDGLRAAIDVAVTRARETVEGP